MPLTLASNAITFTDNTALSSGVIGTAQLSAGAVTTTAIASGAVTFAKLASDSKILQSGTVTGTTQQFISTTFTIPQPGWLITTGNCVANYSGTTVNAGNYAFLSHNGTIIAHDGMFEGESGSVAFYSNATGMNFLSAGIHTIQLEHTVTAATRNSSRLSWVVFPV